MDMKWSEHLLSKKREVFCTYLPFPFITLEKNQTKLVFHETEWVFLVFKGKIFNFTASYMEITWIRTNLSLTVPLIDKNFYP